MREDQDRRAKSHFVPAFGRTKQGAVRGPRDSSRRKKPRNLCLRGCTPLAPDTAAARSFRDRAVFPVAAGQRFGPGHGQRPCGSSVRHPCLTLARRRMRRRAATLCSNMRALDPACAVPLLGGGDGALSPNPPSMAGSGGEPGRHSPVTQDIGCAHGLRFSAPTTIPAIPIAPRSRGAPRRTLWRAGRSTGDSDRASMPPRAKARPTASTPPATCRCHPPAAARGTGDSAGRGPRCRPTRKGR